MAYVLMRHDYGGVSVHDTRSGQPVMIAAHQLAECVSGDSLTVAGQIQVDRQILEHHETTESENGLFAS